MANVEIILLFIPLFFKETKIFLIIIWTWNSVHFHLSDVLFSLPLFIRTHFLMTSRLCVSSFAVWFFFKVFKFWWLPSIMKRLSLLPLPLPQLDTPWAHAVPGRGMLGPNPCAPGKVQTGAVESGGMSVFRFSALHVMLWLCPSVIPALQLRMQVTACQSLRMPRSQSRSLCWIIFLSLFAEPRFKRPLQKQKTRTTPSLGSIILYCVSCAYYT